MSEPTGNKFAPALWAIGVLAIVGGIVGFGWKNQSQPTRDPDVIASTAPTLARLDHDYYVFVHLVEFKPTKPNGSRWDSGSHAAPDPDVRIYWRGNRVFTLPTRSDQLIATWDLFSVDVMQLVSNGGRLDVASVINAPLVHVMGNEAITIEVYDDDVTFNDLALKTDLVLSDLREGRNDITPAADSGLLRLRVDLIDRTTPLPKLIELASER